MKNHRTDAGRSRLGFTLIEMLVVIAIIAILAGILLPALARGKTTAKINKAKTEMANLAASIKQYETEYNRYPASKLVEDAAKPPTGIGDFTFGSAGVTSPGYSMSNSLVMYILLNEQKKAPVIFQIDQRNPRGMVFMEARMTSGNAPGISSADYTFRDPWGNPYIITLDMNDNSKCIDAFYGSKSGKGLSQIPTGEPNAGKYELNGSVMIWSYGPDARIDAGADSDKGANKDNILSWQ